MEEVIFERKGPVEVITLNRPDKLNALTLGMVRELDRRIRDLEVDDEVRAVVITGKDKAFCGGADLAGGGGREDAATPLGMRLSAQAYSRMITAMCCMEKPVIGAINGDAAGGGCNFALACDILIASETARFIQIFVRRGLVADCGGSFFLPRMIGLTRAKELMFTGEPLVAERALELGVVVRVVPPEKLMDEAMDLAGRLAAGPTRAIGMMKTMLNHSFESDLETALDRESSMQGIAVSTTDVVEGITAFLQKREPEFKGK
ncbi:MAG: enoyl-CoA hydratase/isomerase family protein [Actinobacteria bacterium]|nr:enoyl-CoA hydratase/isomerase family protein [Actinomycetota bacterium]MBU4301904.1 enoyl-CoA hydratase/isomerase family protein [Actinomycetota bacterium]MBU4386042.1 enoyl-CoA hydratase/isomerase family protein [Actinomycetota bacterium]MBU4490459.1 enoyl-CoA hydratase/isomerase family protein [Actinomycetota bacterium]MCG2796204.1 enoyl-CoA hydratase-related protein [Actinomycetes bacterium]